jgi:hypothetical protein
MLVLNIGVASEEGGREPVRKKEKFYEAKKRKMSENSKAKAKNSSACNRKRHEYVEKGKFAGVTEIASADVEYVNDIKSAVQFALGRDQAFEEEQTHERGRMINEVSREVYASTNDSDCHGDQEKDEDENEHEDNMYTMDFMSKEQFQVCSF